LVDPTARASRDGYDLKTRILKVLKGKECLRHQTTCVGQRVIDIAKDSLETLACSGVEVEDRSHELYPGQRCCNYVRVVAT
jgi:hypothetical protein